MRQQGTYLSSGYSSMVYWEGKPGQDTFSRVFNSISKRPRPMCPFWR